MENSKSKIIVALDEMQESDVKQVITSCLSNKSEELSSRISFKVNDLLLLIGLKGLKDLSREITNELKIPEESLHWMVDPKLNDIPNTAGKNDFSRLKQSGLNADYITIMASGGRKMMEAAVQKRNELGLKTKILAVTVLTSFDDKGAKEVYNEGTKYEVLKLAKLALESGVDGIVCSALEAPMLREVFGDKYNFEIVTPGIRLEGQKVSADDQKRTKTPKDAINSGSSHLVVGRPIIQSSDKIATIEEILKQMDEAEYIEPKEKKFVFEKLLYNGEWKEILEYIGAIYRRPEGGSFVRLASGLVSDGYINVGGVMDRNFRILERASDELASELNKNNIKGDIVMGAQMGSVRLSSCLAKSLGIEKSIYAEKKDKEMILDRHDIDLNGKNVIISEDVITKLSTTIKMIDLVEKKGGKVVAITCVSNRSGKDNYKGIPIVSCYTPEPFGMYYNDRSIEEMADNLDDEKIISLIIDGVFEWVIAYGEDEKNINLSNLEIKEKLNKIKAYSRKLIALKEILSQFRFKTNVDNLFDLGLKKMLKQDGVLPLPEDSEVEENPKDNWGKLIEEMKK